MVLKVSTEQRIFNILEYQRRKELENLNNFSLKIRPEQKNCEFFITILRIFCDFVSQSFKILDFDRNSFYKHFCFSELLILREKKVCGFFGGPLKYQKKLQILKKKNHTGELHKKDTILYQSPQITLCFDSL